jgi:nucleotide-binding universal stress UspA family protein
MEAEYGYRHIVVAIDGSPESQHALEHAVRIARASNAALDLLAVSPVSSTVEWGGRTQPIALNDVAYAETLRRAAVSIVDQPVTTYLQKGDPATAIVSHAVDHQCDLIVMGSRGRGRAAVAVLGSTSLAVIRRAPVPVTVVHPSAEVQVPAQAVG